MAGDREDYFESDYESLPQRDILVHRVQLRQDLMKEFIDPNILKFKLNVKVIDERGEEEKGVGNGVLRDTITEFWKLFGTAVTLGGIEKVPCIRHDFQRGEWEAVGRLFVYSVVHIRYVPIFLSPAFIATCLFGEDVLGEKELLGAFRSYISSDEREVFDKCLGGKFCSDDEELLDFLSAYKCYRVPSQDNIRGIILELAHQEIVQKPRYIFNCWAPILALSQYWC